MTNDLTRSSDHLHDQVVSCKYILFKYDILFCGKKLRLAVNILPFDA